MSETRGLEAQRDSLRARVSAALVLGYLICAGLFWTGLVLAVGEDRILPGAVLMASTALAAIILWLAGVAASEALRRGRDES